MRLTRTLALGASVLVLLRRLHDGWGRDAVAVGTRSVRAVAHPRPPPGAPRRPRPRPRR